MDSGIFTIAVSLKDSEQTAVLSVQELASKAYDLCAASNFNMTEILRWYSLTSVKISDVQDYDYLNLVQIEAST